jgi:hypothetical protein
MTEAGAVLHRLRGGGRTRQETGNIVKLRKLAALGLLGMGMTLLPIATGIAGADNNSGNPNNGNSQGQGHQCTPRGKHNHYPPGQCKMELSSNQTNRGGSVDAFSEGWSGATNVAYSLHSDPIQLTTAAADATGDSTATLVIPCSATPGSHTVVASGVLPDGTPFTQSAALTVTGKACVLGETVTNTAAPATPAAASGTTSSSSLPFTGGAATTGLVTLALGLIAAGGVAVTSARRRRTTS